MKIYLPEPHSGHRIILDNARRINVYVAGRRHFKTTFLSTLASEGGLDGKYVIACAPTFDQVRVLYNNVEKMVKGQAKFNMTRMEATFRTGGHIWFRSLDNPNNVRGHTADLVLIDEAGFCKAEGWYEVLRPMLFTTGGDAWLAGTPQGRNYFWVEYQKQGDDRISFHAPTVGCKVVDGKLFREPHPLENPHIPFKEIEEYFLSVPLQVFEQEVLAQFAEQNNPVFRRIRENTTAKHYDKRQGSWEYVISVDLAKHVDFSVLTVLDMTNQQVVFIDRFNQLDYSTQRNRLTALYERFKPIAMVIEVNSAGEPFCEELEKLGLPIKRFTTTNASKKRIIESLALAFEQDKIKIPNNEVLINELLSFQSERLPSGKIRYSAPSNMHDDCVLSLALGWDYFKSREKSKITYSEIVLPW